MGRHSPQRKAQVLAALEASAAQHGGKPSWNPLARETGIAATTLKRWWARRDEMGNVRAMPQPGRDDPDSAPNPRHATDVDFRVWLYHRSADGLLGAIGNGVIHSIPAFLKSTDEAWTKARTAIEDARDDETLTPAQEIAELEAVAREVSDSGAVAMYQVLKKRLNVA